MVNYKKIYVSNINSEIIEETYRSLLENKWHFVILDVNIVSQKKANTTAEER